MTRGGAERVMSLLFKEFSRTHKVHLIIFSGPVEYDIDGDVINLDLPNDGGRIRKMVNVFRRTQRLKKELKRLKPDLIISFIGNIQPILTFFPVIVSIRIDLDYTDEYSNKRVNHMLLKTLYRFKNVKKIVTVSKAIQKKLEDRYHFNNVTTIYNPIDFEAIEVQASEQRPVDYKYVLAVGSFKSQNGFDLLIRAFAESKMKKDIRLVILGDGHERNKYESLIIELGLQGKVMLPGKTKNPYVYMRNAEFFILSSRYEGFPNVLIEALACSAACIATDCETGPNEIIEPGQNGMLIPVENVEELTRAMDVLFSDDSLRKKFSQNARQSISHLELSQIASQWLKLDTSST